MVQGSERKLHIKLAALNKASNAIKSIEQSLLPSGCREGIGYGSEITHASTSAGTVFIRESIKDTPIKPTATSVVTGEGKEKEGLSEPSKNISKIQKKVSSGEVIQAKEHSCAKPERIAYQPKKQIASKVESDIACKRIPKRVGLLRKSALRSKANASKADKSVSFAPIHFRPQFPHPFEDESPSTYIPPYFKVRKNNVFKDGGYYHYESTPDSYIRVTIPRFHKGNTKANDKRKRIALTCTPALAIVRLTLAMQQSLKRLLNPKRLHP